MSGLYSLLLFIFPVIHYTVKVDPADTTGYTVEMRLQHAPAHFQLAMATHPEYDDRFWRFVKDLKVAVPLGKAGVTRQDSALYAIDIPGGEAVITYRIQLPAIHSYAHRPFLSSYGGLVGDIHSFFYLVGQTRLPVTVHVELPPGWQIATGLEPTADSTTFTASSAADLMDCPIMVGRLRSWHFQWGGVPYAIAYLPEPGSPSFDTVLLVDNIQKIVRQAVDLFGGTPYRHYTFLLEDGVYGALEHANSVTIGAPASLLASHMEESYEEIAHEFFHSWNLISIRPEEYTDLNYGPQERSAGLWFSEGLSMFYADLLVRRAGLPCEDSTRIAHLESLIGRYYADTGNRVFSPAAVSLAANAEPGATGDYSASTHLQGELLGALLDIFLRNCSDGRHSFDDVMRAMYQRFGGKKGFKAQDVEQTVDAVCNNPGVHQFFDTYLYQGKPLDFENFLRLLGLRLQLSWVPATDGHGKPAPDNRLYVWQLPGDSLFRLAITDPRSCWGRTGLQTGDAVLAMNGQTIQIRTSFYAHRNAFRIGDTVSFQIRRSNTIRTVRVGVTGYTQVIAHILPALDADNKSLTLFRQWNSGL
jgi:predicted metalloprotease with PDZ domain